MPAGAAAACESAAAARHPCLSSPAGHNRLWGAVRTLEEQPCRSEPNAGSGHGHEPRPKVRILRHLTAGRRAPWLLLGTPLLMAGTVLMWLPPALDDATLLAWYALCYFLVINGGTASLLRAGWLGFGLG